jgi:uncharacterized membrane protein YfcA
MISSMDAAFLLVAGVLAGLVGSAGAITSLVSYPALLAVGIPALAASVANSVALVFCWPGSALASRPELAGRAPWVRRWLPVPVVGGAAGAALLLCTPAHVFAAVVPVLVAGASLAVLLEPRLAARRRRRTGEQRRLLLPAGLLVLSTYNGYFGAGSGVMILTLLMLTVDRHLPRANALKNMLIGAGSLVSAAAFVVFASVRWSAVVPLGVGMLVGSRLGPPVARALPREALRWLIAIFGLGLALQLWLYPTV